MSRKPQSTDFRVPVEGVGEFVFAKRAMRDEIDIQVEYARMLQGVEPTNWLQAVCGWLSDLRVLIVRAPDSFDLDELDPLDPETYAKLGRVHGGLKEKENSFRQPKGEIKQATGA